MSHLLYYDDLYRVTDLTHRDPSGRETDSYRYEYDSAGNKTSIQKTKTDEDEIEEDEGKTFAYDTLSQLVTVSEMNGNSKNFYYDTLGNRVAFIEQDKTKNQPGTTVTTS